MNLRECIIIWFSICLLLLNVALYVENINLNDHIDELIAVNQEIAHYSSDSLNHNWIEGWATGVDMTMFAFRREIEIDPSIGSIELYNSNVKLFNEYNSSLIRTIPEMM